MSIQFPFHRKTEINSSVVQFSRMTILQNFQRMYEKSSIFSLSPYFCQKVTDLIKRCFSCFFFKTKSQNVSSITSTISPIIASTTTIARPMVPLSTGALMRESLPIRIALVKHAVYEHLVKNDWIRQRTMDPACPYNQRGVIIRLFYNRQEVLIKKNWADGNLLDFIGNRIEVFLSSETNRNSSDENLLIHTIYFQKRGSSFISYDNPYCHIYFSTGKIVSGREHGTDSPPAFKTAVTTFIHNDLAKAAACDFIDNLEVRQNSDAI